MPYRFSGRSAPKGWERPFFLILFCDTSELNQQLVETAGRFADGFAPRCYDSVQLAAAHELHVKAEQTVIFASYDLRLNQAAQLFQLEEL